MMTTCPSSISFKAEHPMNASSSITSIEEAIRTFCSPLQFTKHRSGTAVSERFRKRESSPLHSSKALGSSVLMEGGKEICFSSEHP